MTGKLYCIGVGPGDPELLTIKGQKILNCADVIAFPDQSKIACQIALRAVPCISGKPHLPFHMPMSTDPDVLHSAHLTAVGNIRALLEAGKTVAVLTLGDPAFYSSFSYLLEHFRLGGFEVEVIPGVASFSAASAMLLQPLALGTEPVHILTSVDDYDPDYAGALVILKAGRQLGEWKAILRERRLWLVENCGMSNEKVYYNDLPDTAGYFSLLIAK